MNLKISKNVVCFARKFDTGTSGHSLSYSPTSCQQLARNVAYESRLEALSKISEDSEVW